MGVELLHPRFDYQPEHFHRVGYIKMLRPDEIAQADAAMAKWLQAQVGQPLPEDVPGEAMPMPWWKPSAPWCCCPCQRPAPGAPSAPPSCAPGLGSFISAAAALRLIDWERLDEAEETFVWAEQVANPDDPKLEQIRQRLHRAQVGEPIRPAQIKLREEKPAGPFSALADLTGADLSEAPGLGRAALWRRKANGGLAKSAAEFKSLKESPAWRIETGLLRAAEQGWREGAAWFDEGWERHAGDGVLRVHRLRCHARAGKAVDWSYEHQLYPELLPVILTEEHGDPPPLPWKADDPNLGEEQRQELWFADVANLPGLRDVAEEDFLTARSLAT